MCLMCLLVRDSYVSHFCVFFSFMNRICLLVCDSHFFVFLSRMYRLVRDSYVSHVCVLLFVTVFSFVTHLSLISVSDVSSRRSCFVPRRRSNVSEVQNAHRRNTLQHAHCNTLQHIRSSLVPRRRSNISEVQNAHRKSRRVFGWGCVNSKSHLCVFFFFFESYVSSCSWLSFMLQTAHRKSRRVFCVC